MEKYKRLYYSISTLKNFKPLIQIRNKNKNNLKKKNIKPFSRRIFVLDKLRGDKDARVARKLTQTRGPQDRATAFSFYIRKRKEQLGSYTNNS